MSVHAFYRLNGRSFLAIAALLLSGMAGLLGGCVVPVDKQVDSGLHPQYQDDDVRFRTTYYFRVFDYCADEPNGAKTPGTGNKEEAGPETIQTPFAIDSLYRFHMTGKANSLTTEVNFESGTLTAGQIDPFGATIAFDKENKQHYFKSQGEVQREAARVRQFEELDRLVKRYRQLEAELRPKTDETSDGSSISPNNDKLLNDFYRIISQQVELIIGKSISTSDLTPEEIFEVYKNIVAQKKKLAAENPNEDLAAYDDMLSILKDRLERLSQTQIGQIESSQPKDDYCKNLRRGFQILGPEGWRTFNQDDRLIMAMTTSGKPLIGTMEELSGRVLENQPIEAELLLPLIEEDLRITRAQRALDRFSVTQPDQVLQILEDAVNAFNGETQTEESK